MGILSKESNVPSVAISSNQTTTSTDSTSDTESTSSTESEVSSYLDSKRGKVGTVLTSWQGLLDKDTTQPTRKTLLGE